MTKPEVKESFANEVYLDLIERDGHLEWSYLIVDGHISMNEIEYLQNVKKYIKSKTIKYCAIPQCRTEVINDDKMRLCGSCGREYSRRERIKRNE